MTIKELENKIITLQNSLNNVVKHTPFVTAVEAKIKECPLETLDAYSEKFGETPAPINSAGYVHLNLFKFGSGFKTCITIISERQKITLTKA